MWERVNCTSSSPLKIYVTHAFMNSLIFFCYPFILAFAYYFFIPTYLLFIYFWLRGKSLINKNFMQEEITSRLNLGYA
jgi:hypothetical protein